ncbi:zinc ribbon domain-containing protein [Pseudoalteromonas fenneropenaei]|uniref:Zinc ribbon domain-containing protein n=1 Tax=Pseudoalteromonas fenneropenaei TaxID=1737459 RepID=A0ABV7CJM8_9GAMM
MNKHCQSCGMPLKGDTSRCGTNADGSRSDDFCTHCFVAGQFTQPDFNLGRVGLCSLFLQQ